MSTISLSKFILVLLEISHGTDFYDDLDILLDNIYLRSENKNMKLENFKSEIIKFLDTRNMTPSKKKEFDDFFASDWRFR